MLVEGTGINRVTREHMRRDGLVGNAAYDAVQNGGKQVKDAGAIKGGDVARNAGTVQYSAADRKNIMRNHVKAGRFSLIYALANSTYTAALIHPSFVGLWCRFCVGLLFFYNPIFFRAVFCIFLL